MPPPSLDSTGPITYLVSSLPPKTGGEIYAYKLYEFLGQRGRTQEYLPIDKIIDETRVQLLRYFRRLVYLGWLGDLLTSLGLAYRLQKLKGVLVVDQYHSFLLLATKVVHRWRRRGKIITLVHHIENYASDAPPSWSNWLWKWRERLALSPSHMLVTVSEHTKREIISLGIPEDKITILPPGLDREKLEIHPAERGADLLCVAHIIPRKGIHHLVEAFASLNFEGARLHLAGDTKADPGYVAQIRARLNDLGVADRIIFHGRIGQTNLNRLYSEAGIFVFPSLQEGFGIALLEAMHYGLPIVASHNSAIPHLVHEEVNGLLVPSGEAGPLAEAIRRLQEDSELRKTLGRRGREMVENMFYWETTCEGFASLVEQPAARTGSMKVNPPVKRKPQFS